MFPLILLARLAILLVLVHPIITNGSMPGSPVATPASGAPLYATAILEGLGGTGWARDINAGGDIVGYVTEPDSAVKLPALWRAGALELLEAPDHPGGVATAINDSGIIVGYLQMPEGDPRPVVWRDGVPTVLDTPAGVGYAYAVNNPGQVVGEVQDAAGEWQPALWDGSRLTILDTGDGVGGQARDINDAGQVVGHLWESDPGPDWDGENPVRAVMWDRGEMRVLGPRGSCAWEVSASGVVVGTTPDPDGAVNPDGEPLSRAVTWRDGEMTWIDAGEDVTESLGMAIEDGVGVAISARSGEEPPRAVLVIAGGPVSLEGLSDVSKPEAVNANGVVVGSAVLDGSQAVRWIPAGDLAGLPTTSDVTGSWAVLALPSLGGDAWANDLNASGTVVGSVEHASSGVQRPAMWRDGELTVLEGLEGREGAAMDINDAGVPVGFANNAAGDSRPVRWDGRQPTDLGTLGGPEGFAEAINNAGQIAGWAETPDGTRHAVLWNDGEIVDLGTMGDDESIAFDINDAGKVLILSGSPLMETMHAALWEEGVARPLAPSSGDFFWATAVNARGDVVGLTVTPNGQPQGVALEGGRWRQIDAPAGQAWFPVAVNDDGIVVGEATRIDDEDDWSAAVVWRDGAEASLLPEAVGLSSTAMAVNDRGIVAGQLQIGGDERAVVWIPVAALLPDAG